MATKLYVNAILVGQIDSFCLICETHLRGEDEALKHITEPSHILKFESLQALEKYKEDHIIKVKQGYYCVYCNTVFPTATKMSLHVSEATHKDNRGTRLLKVEGAAIVYQDILVTANAWHGIAGEMCTVCNTEFDDEALHVKEPTHIFNLTRNKVEFGSQKEIYRKIDNSTFQCITCNQVFSLEALTSHFEDTRHKDMVLKSAMDYQDFKQKQNNEVLTEDIIMRECKITATEKISESNETNINKSNHTNSISTSSSDSFTSAECSSDESTDGSTKYTKDENRAQILDLVSVFEKNEVNINFQTETAMCKKCFSNIDFDYKTIEKHIDEHKNNPTKRDVGYVPFQCEVDMKGSVIDTQASSELRKGIPAIDFESDNAKSAETSPAKLGLDENHNVTINPSKPEKEVTRANDASAEESAAEFAKKNKLTYNRNNHNAFCRVCEAKLPSSLRSMKEHVSGNAHRKRLHTLSSNTNSSSTTNAHCRSTTSKIYLEEYMDDVFTIESMFEGETVVNFKFCMDILSFHLVTKFGGRLRCQVCEMSLSRYDFDEHKDLYSHKQSLLRTSVMLKYDSEFVREVRPDLFHCAFCNLLEMTEPGLRKHFESSEHKEKKSAMEARLQRHLPALRQHKMARDMDFIMHLMMRERNRFFF